ncbi:hypothetical protein SDC9_20888 [bioreactor metagenome]|uniref:Uncharacterized protein n=1 Tax=bioreactor metagenome TaxID=1076179 RepID=A0A644U7Z2_9ZZZZ
MALTVDVGAFLYVKGAYENGMQRNGTNQKTIR